MQNEHSLSHIISQFELCTQWEEKFKLLMQFSKSLKIMPCDYKVEKNLLEGCESQVWVHLEFDMKRQKVVGYFDSDSKLLRGILYIVEKYLEEQNINSIQGIDLEGIFNQIGILHKLSSNRKTGLKSIQKVIIAFSSTLKAKN